ncbi:MAG: class I SAM-dependent methyltransferase [Thiobacillus sp.]|nr:class I SAM-dependent methyltransferase [Thiobacillus sp.]
MTQRLYWLGNAAKSRVIDEILASNPGPEPVTVFDYGCGDGGDWPSILAEHPKLRLVGYEPYVPSCRKARERLRNHAAEILTGNDIDALPIKADYIVSFSVFEHVVHRAEFLRHAKRILGPNGMFYLNYDDGHFRNLLDVSRPATWMPALRAWGRTAVSRPFAAFGLQSHYQRRVSAVDADRLVVESGFRIERVDYHNLVCLKDLAKAMPESFQQGYAAWWLDSEKQLNEQFHAKLPEKRFGDSSNLWQQMLSRTLCLRHF